MTETLRIWSSSVYPGEQGRLLGTLTFGRRPESADEPIIGAWGELEKDVEDGTLRTIGDVRAMVRRDRKQMHWEGAGDFGACMPHDQR